MEDPRKHTVRELISSLLLSNKRHARYLRVLAVLALAVTVIVPLAVRQYGFTMTVTKTVLDCHYDGNGAHTHNADCYDEDGNLVCPLPERPLHTHTAECYATESVLVCGLEESADHTHTDACYETRQTDQLICGLEETTDEHVHGPACFATVTTQAPDSEEDPTPEQEFTGTLKDNNLNIILVAEVKAPQGALPKGSTMRVEEVDLQKREEKDGPTVQDKLNEALRKEAGDTATFVQTDAVDITFYDAQGNRVDPAKKVEVRITTSMIRDYSDQTTAQDEAAINNSLMVLHVVDKQQTKRDNAPDAEVIEKAYLANRDKDDHTTGHEDTIVFEAAEFSPYVVARVNNVQLTAAAETVEEEKPAQAQQLATSAEAQPQEPEAALSEKPAQEFSQRIADGNDQAAMTVNVSAPEGAFPQGTTMQVAWVDASHIEEAVSMAVSERTDGKLYDMRAVDITFIDAEGHKIEPAKKITVTFVSDVIDTQDDSYIVHVDDVGNAEVIDALGSEELQQREMADQTDELVFESDSFSTYVVAVTTLHKELTASDGETYDITVDAPAEAGIPQDAELLVSEIVEGDERYAEYLEQTLAALNLESDESGMQQVRLFDIKIVESEQEIQPQAPVVVHIGLSDADKSADTASFDAVHFIEEADTAEAEVLESSQEAGVVTFETNGFSVFGVVYTVDFQWEVDGVMYNFTIDGGGSVSLTALAEALHLADGYAPAEDEAVVEDAAEQEAEASSNDEGAQASVYSTSSDKLSQADTATSDATKAFMDQVESVEFSNPELLWVGHIEKDSRLWDLMQEHGFKLNARANTEQQYLDIVMTEYAAPDWVLVSLKPFESEETLTLTMKDGSTIAIRVTDAQDAPMKAGADGDVVDTITNPAGTTIDLFDYWILDQYALGRSAWPGHKGDDVYNHAFDIYKLPGATGDSDWEGNNLRYDRVWGNGNDQGINEGHIFKFEPASGSSVQNGVVQDHHNVDGTPEVNSYTGDGDPNQGIVQKTLSGGYPILTDDQTGMKTDGSSLAYLFDTTSHNGKAAYRGVDHLLYVDSEGYYTYDSRDYAATFNTGDNTFTLRAQTANPATEEGRQIRGFWPFAEYGERNYWSGLHINAPFSMPRNGQVLNPKGDYKDMQFEFSGDDDTWIYIDGVLVGDGGGIHNRTEIDINFATGVVTVTGREDPNHPGTFFETYTLKELFEQAGRDVTSDFEGETFKAGTYHTFDMFYLERGGGESNLYIHYNLVSTADFTAHKEYHGETDDEVLSRNQFLFDLIGLDGRYNADGELIAPDERAIMPERPNSTTTNPDEEGAGTIAKPLYIENYGIEINNVNRNSQLYRLGVTEDGNVNFGSADITDEIKRAVEAGNPPVYRYVVREHVPDDAVNAQGKKWKDCTDAERKLGGFSLGDVSYDGTIYYMSAKVTSWQPNDPDGNPMVDGQGRPVLAYGLSKTYYIDETYTTTLDEEHSFINFDNRHVQPLALKINKKDDKNESLPGAEFKLSFAVKDTTTGAWSAAEGVEPMTGTTGADGTLKFENLTAGNYILEETKAPSGYSRATNKWLVELVREDEETTDGTDTQKTSHLVPYITLLNVNGSVADDAPREQKDVVEHQFEHEVINEPSTITVEKKWLDENGDDLDDHPDQIAFTVYQLQHEHIWGEWFIDKEPTEDEEGAKHRFCSVDDARQDVVIPKADHIHTLVEIDPKAATCTESGNIHYWECAKCHLKFSDGAGQNQIDDVTIPALGHDYRMTSETSATCTEAGTKTWTCDRCSDTYTEELPALGHDWSEWISDGDGQETRSCNRCQQSETRDAQNLYPGSQIVLDDFVWPTEGGQLRPTGIFRYGDEFWIIVQEQYVDPSNASQGPSGVEGWGVSVRPQGGIQEVSVLFPDGVGGNGHAVEKGTLVQDSDGNYYVRTRTTSSSEWTSYPSSGADGWYKLPAISTASLTQNAPRRQLTSLKTPAVSETGAKSSELRLDAQAVPSEGLTEQMLLEALGLTAIGTKDENTGNKLVVYNRYTLDTPIGDEHLWSKDIVIEVEDDSGIAYKYYVVENNPSPGGEYITTYDGQDNGLGDRDVVTITNQLKVVDIRVLKADADTLDDDTIKYLAGATFYLNKGDYRQHPTVISLEDGTPEVPVGEDGSFTIPTESGVKIVGLRSGTYTLHETAAPAGYIINGNGDWTFTLNTSEEEITGTDVAKDLVLTIPNTPGTPLPMTGGPGTFLYTLCGTALFAAAGFVGFASRRKARKEVA